MSADTVRGAAPRRRGPVADGLTMTRRHMAHLARTPEEAALYFALPIMFVLVFGYVFGSGMSVAGGGNYREFLVPGVFAMTMLYGMGSSGSAIAVDARRGVVDRFRSMPIARSALLTGRCTADMLRGVIELLVVLMCGLLVGWTWHRGIGRMLLALLLVLALRLAITWIGIYLGLLVRNEDAVGGIVFPLAFPLTAVSNVFTSPELMPGWLGTVSEWNPLSATVTALRDLFGNPGVGGSGWASDNALLLAILWPAVLTAIFAPLAVRRYKALGR
ncbi:ABC transporter permease [Streptomyces avicenniae]|uniref:ABC transporter permease n=1 Tax=Streptomyces avicenniae TaxID=500153 RepID=UPI0006999BB8|nr:ABC transporter permease [Streptomyces avicenniae]